jgi:hypothetical protein
MEMSILKFGLEYFNGIYWNLYVQGESHRVQKDNHVIKSIHQEKLVVNKITWYGLWFNYGMIP